MNGPGPRRRCRPAGKPASTEGATVLNLLGRVSVFPVLPARIQGLRDLATNMWWSWNPEAQGLFTKLDAALWEQVYHNPVRFLSEIDQERLDAAAGDNDFLAAFDEVQRRF